MDDLVRRREQLRKEKKQIDQTADEAKRDIFELCGKLHTISSIWRFVSHAYVGDKIYF